VGQAIVAEHMKAAGAHVVFSTVLGDDAYKDFVLKHLQKSGVECRAVIDATRPTVNKNAIVAGGYRLLKLDTLDNRPISGHVLQQLTHATSSTPVDAVVFSDFRHGIFNRGTIPKFVEAIPDGCYRVADSQVASRWGNITEFKGFDLITPNEREARFALADQDSGIRPLASSLYDEANCKLLILKLGDRGVLTCRGVKHEPHDSFFVIDSFVDRLVDAVGAGDALLAYSTLAMLTNKNPCRCDDPRQHGGGLRMRSRRKFSGHSRRRAQENRRHRKTGGRRLSFPSMRVISCRLGRPGSQT
jgi:bifunctional ADP-heptose synthase (sugar kinase/adenylyltransferase)